MQDRVKCFLFCHHVAWNQLTVSSDQYGKRIQVHQGGKLDIYIALDVSDSIDEKDFKNAKEVISKLIEKVYNTNMPFWTISATYSLNLLLYISNF